MIAARRMVVTVSQALLFFFFFSWRGEAEPALFSTESCAHTPSDCRQGANFCQIANTVTDRLEQSRKVIAQAEDLSRAPARGREHAR
jgi:hypothetical protein